MWLKDKIVCCRRHQVPCLGLGSRGNTSKIFSQISTAHTSYLSPCQIIHIPSAFRFHLNTPKGYDLNMNFKPSLSLFNIYEVPPLSPGDCCEQVSAPSIGLSPLSALSRPSTNKPPLTVTSLHSPVKISATDIPNHLYHCLNQSSSVSPTEFGTVKMRKIQWGHV